jgi:hypothetical protein
MARHPAADERVVDRAETLIMQARSSVWARRVSNLRPLACEVGRARCRLLPRVAPEAG